MPMYGDHIEAYKDQVVYDFYKSMPTLRDETIFLGGELDQLYSAAIRSGDHGWSAPYASSQPT